MARDTETLALEIVTPTGVALRADVTEVTTPGAGGEFGILPGHLPTLAALRTGLVRYFEGGAEHVVAVSHGFCEATLEKVIVLTEAFKRESDVDVVGVRSRLREVDEELEAWDGEITDPRRKELIEEEQWLATQLELVGDPPPPQVREDTRFLEPERDEAPREVVDTSDDDEHQHEA
jgi:F-type H+-transporting ATPase subunit epsilon